MTLTSGVRGRLGLLTLLGLGGVVFSQAPGIEGQEVFPLDDAVYSSGVVTPAGATLAVLGGIEGEGSSVQAAATDALNKMETRLREVGLDRNRVVRVRAGLAPGDGSEFPAWNEAWTGFFTGGHLPARTTVGSSGVPGTALVVLDVVAMYPTEAGYPARVDGARATPNPNIRHAGPAENPTAIVSTQAGLYISAGVLGSRQGLEDPDSMELQIRSGMNRLTNSLGGQGLQWPDVFFVRVLPTPQPGRDTPDFEGWAPVYRTLDRITGGNAPPFTMWAAPGFSGNGTFIELEVWAVPHAPHSAFSVYDPELANPYLIMSGSPTSQIASGATIAPNPELVWLSGVIAPAGTAPEDEGMAALDVMKQRVEEMGASMADVAELRVYRTPDESGFNAGYSAHFNNEETNPHRPARTNYLVESLPMGRTVEVEAILVRPPGGF
jgi:enamine deaminase RidA (YjgF/YER057c/UK114 family)